MKDILYPFLWVIDDDEKSLLAEIDGIAASGATAFCVESRIHPDFCGPRWWKLMDAILDRASAKGMRVWLLDDKHYPTGSAADAIGADSPLRPWRIKADCVDLEGIPGEIRLLLNSESDLRSEDRILGVWTVRTDGSRSELIQDVTDRVQDDFLTLDFDGTPCRVCCVKQTRGGAEGAGRDRYVDMLNPSSVDVLIETVYRPHWERYGKKYAGVFEGFFSDEPRFANGFANIDLRHGYDEYNCRVGVPGMAYPWREDLFERLAEGLPDFARSDILSLWFDFGARTPALRCRYMDVITQAYAENFSGRLSAWCRERGLTYCGHIIEDMGAHAHLGCSAGHYFRSQRGADCAAVDVVLHQIKPFYRHRHLAPIAGGCADPEFFDATLAKLASSCARLDPEKKGRALCEIFGAYGWGESLSEMAYLANHMLVRGINRFIPHAFSPRFPHPDCPPHFYCGGKNPNFAGYAFLSRRMREAAEWLGGGRAVIRTAVLYHAEADWSGRPYAPVDGVACELLRHQIDFDILPSEALARAEEYDCLLIPYAAWLPPATIRALSSLARVKVLRLSGDPAELAEVVGILTVRGCRTLRFASEVPSLRVLRVRTESGEDRYFVHNEGPCAVPADAVFPDACSCLVRDLLNQTEDLVPVRSDRCALVLEPGQALLLQPSGTVPAHACRRTESELHWTRVGEDGTGVRFECELTLRPSDELEFRYDGELLRLHLGSDTFDRISSPARIRPGLSGTFRARLEIRKNLAERLRDDLSKYSILRPVRLLRALARREGE